MRKSVFCSFLILTTLALSGQISMQRADDGILITEGSQKVLFYNVENQSINGIYERCNYIHPLWGLDGTVLTEDFPEDHLHHRGIFWAWHQIYIDGKRVGDGWEIKNFKQEVTDVEFFSKEDGKAILKAEVKWKSDLWENEIPYLKENTTITIHPKVNNYRKIDFEIKLLALEENLKIGGSEDEKGYGGFSVRMVLPEDVKFSGSKGEVIPQTTTVESNGYINISGSVGKNNSHEGVVIADNKDNPDYPQRWILRAEKSMQNVAFPGKEMIPVSTTKPVILKYSLIIYEGKLSNRIVRKLIQ